MEILEQQNLEEAISYLEETKESLAKTLDNKGKIIQIPIENINFIKDEFNLSDNDVKEILKTIFNLKKQDIIIKYKNSLNIIKYDSDKLNSRFAGFGNEKDVENLMKFFKATYNTDYIINSVNSKINFSNKSNKEVEEFINNGYRKFLFEEYYKNIKNKLSEFIKDPDALDRITKTIAGKILRDNFDKHLENIACKFFNETNKIIQQNLDKILNTTNEELIKSLNLDEPKVINQVKTNLQKIWIDTFIKNLNKIVFIPIYKIALTDEQFIKTLFKIINKHPIAKEKITFYRKSFQKELTLKIIKKIKEIKNSPSSLKHFENLLSFFSGKEIRKGNKKFIFPKISLSFLEEEISNYQNPGKVLLNQIINLSNPKSKSEQERLKELVSKLSNLLGKLPKVKKLN